MAWGLKNVYQLRNAISSEVRKAHHGKRSRPWGRGIGVTGQFGDSGFSHRTQNCKKSRYTAGAEFTRRRSKPTGSLTGDGGHALGEGLAPSRLLKADPS